ncbi:putative ATP-dependent RNA helicase [Kocuria dechangensis]|uniref:ATP-dependent RNA helicase n=1 Tax=Kocuria dechangensis TaxID=1176249 RepID=A0A917LRI5_9MICC|nr:DEAD/DEAH box helicase [Kocuria dechangensis]GGG53405.1 putative ATP-dependent RNA helicase [Kocuria dechangensis]
MATFTDLGVPEALSAVLSQQGIESAFPIQEKTLPDSLAGRDVLGRGRTGSGKTVAFALPLVARLAGLSGGGARAARRANRPTGLVLAPTRELATQIDRAIAPLAEAAGLTTTVIFGGVSQKNQERALAKGADIVIACPGRLEDLLKQNILTLDDIRVTVIDEADHMADMGFLPVVTRILKRTPQGRQRLLFSATLDGGVDKLVKQFLSNPVKHSVDAPQATVSTMDHHVLVVDADEKQELIEALASGTGRRVMFTRTKHRAKKMARKLTQIGIPAVDLHGNLSQNARDRNLAQFSAGDVRVLVATDVAARGVHVDEVELVVHIDPPTEHKSYLHRSGRTARAGASGSVVTVATKEERREVTQLMKAAGVTADFDAVTIGSPVVADLVGERAEKVAYVPQPVQVQGPGGSRGGQSRTRSGAGRGRGGQGRSEQPRSASRDQRPESGTRGGSRPGNGSAPRSAAPARSAAPTRSAAPAYSTESAPDRATQAAARRRSRSPRRASSPQGTATR